MARLLPCLVGPTAVGKTQLSLVLAQKLQGEIVSADSMQVYRGMDIGTAKATPRDRERVRHHCLDLVDPDTPFSVADYQRAAEKALEDIYRRGRLPLLVGGTGLYVRAVVDGLHLELPGPDWELRHRLEAEAERWGDAHLHQRLSQVDPPTARRLHPNDRRRVIRALEVYELSGIPLSVHLEKAKAQGKARPFMACLFGLYLPRPLLYRRVEERVDEQVRQGLLSEVRGLVHRGFGQNIISLQAIGYKEFLPYLAGEIPFHAAVARLKRNTRNLAKRQLTWFRADKRIEWLDMSQMTLDGAAERVAARVRALMLAQGEAGHQTGRGGVP